MSANILAIDQGTTSSRAIIFDKNQKIISLDQQEFTQHFPKSGWVEHDGAQILKTVENVCRNAIKSSGLAPKQISALGITNQRETTLIWDRKTGVPIHNAIVWQDRRTAQYCDHLKSDGLEELFTKKTGLLLDPYFSGTKIRWLLENVDGARQRAQNGELVFGTIDTFVIWHLTRGRSHVTDATNASRTLCYNIETNEWDEELLRILDLPISLFPEVLNCADEFGVVDESFFGAPIPILGVAGDQQAATIGQACFEPGMMKSTYGTGCFALFNTGNQKIRSTNRLLTTIAYRFDGETTYALEGSIFIAGAAVQWLRDGLGIIDNAARTTQMATDADPEQDVILVPAFTGLGAPYWEANARGAIFGLTRATGPDEFARAALEAVCYQTRDLMEAMTRDMGEGNLNTILRVDGGMVASEWTMQFLSDILAAPVDRPTIAETTALGAAWLAGSHAGVWPDQKEFAANWQCEKRFEPTMNEKLRQKKYAHWLKAVASTIAMCPK
ncbi:MAG: glycerol kinase GlpK [Rhizobiaceae bacterium]|nr:glycerol kinase GlpK [Rhizobiaceae bacterium]